MNRLLFNVGKTVAAGGAASTSIKHAENRAQTRVKQDFDVDSYVDIFKSEHGEIHMSEIELHGAAEVVQSMMQSSQSTKGALQQAQEDRDVILPSHVTEPLDDDATSSGSDANRMIEELDFANQPHMQFLFQTSLRMLKDRHVQQACYESLSTDPNLALFFSPNLSLPAPPSGPRAALPLLEAPSSETFSDTHPLADLFTELGRHLQTAGSALQKLGSRIGLLFCIFGMRIRQLVEKVGERGNGETDGVGRGMARPTGNGETDGVGHTEKPSAQDGVLGAIMTLGMLIMTVALLRRRVPSYR